MKRNPKMRGVLSCLLALVLALSITPSVFAEEPVAGTGKTNYVDAINGNDAQDGVGTTSATAYKTVAAAVAVTTITKKTPHPIKNGAAFAPSFFFA